MRTAILVGLLCGASAGWSVAEEPQQRGQYRGFEVRVDKVQQGSEVGGQYSAIQSIQVKLPGHEMLALRLKFEADEPAEVGWVKESRYARIDLVEVSLQDEAGAEYQPWSPKYNFELAKFNKKRKKGEAWFYFVVPEGLEAKTASLKLGDQLLRVKK